jgi:hypothetical protein
VPLYLSSQLHLFFFTPPFQTTKGSGSTVHYKKKKKGDFGLICVVIWAEFWLIFVDIWAIFIFV